MSEVLHPLTTEQLSIIEAIKIGAVTIGLADRYHRALSRKISVFTQFSNEASGIMSPDFQGTKDRLVNAYLSELPFIFTPVPEDYPVGLKMLKVDIATGMTQADSIIQLGAYVSDTRLISPEYNFTLEDVDFAQFGLALQNASGIIL